MNIKGICRPLDKLGRIVIPMEMRKILNLHPGDTLDTYLYGANIFLNTHKETTSKNSLPPPLLEELVSVASYLPDSDVLMFIDLMKRIVTNKNHD